MYRTKPMSGKSNKLYQLLGGIGRQTGGGAGGMEAFFFLPQTCGNRFYRRLLHKERVRGKNILVSNGADLFSKEDSSLLKKKQKQSQNKAICA